MASTAAAVDDSQVSGARKGSPSAAASGSLRPPEQGIRCPRCDSPNTKFCYYNNYSLSQPRHFCKTCRRYWTKGGALRNVPVGGGCRKNKRSRSAASSSVSSRLSLNPVGPITGAPDPGSLNFLSGSSPLGAATTADFQLGMLPFPRLHSPTTNQYMPFGELPSAAAATSLVGFNYPAASAAGAYTQEMASTHGLNSSAAVSSSIASSIESLSFINQDLHWKLQQQRLATMFLGPAGDVAPQREGGASAHASAFLVGQQPYEPLALHMVGNAKELEEGCMSNTGQPRKGCFTAASAMDTMPAAWFMDSSYTFPSLATSTAAVATTSSGNDNINSGTRSSGGGDDNNNNSNNCNGAIPAWSDMPTFTMLP